MGQFDHPVQSRATGRTIPNAGRPPQLDDRAWLQTRYQRHGETKIARELGVSRGTVRRARERLGIPAQPPGRRRGSKVIAIRSNCRPATLRIAARITREQAANRGRTPSLALIAKRLAELHAAHNIGDQPAVEDALEGLAAAACMMLDHLQHLRIA